MTQTVSSAVATRDRSDQLVSWIRSQQADIAMAAASHIKPSAIVRVTQGALRRDPKLLAAAIANPQSLLYALLDCARLGHEPDTDDYYLVPFGNEVTGIEGYKGIIERMYRAGAVSSVVAQVVRKSDVYRSRGENTPPLHEYDDFASDEERGPMRGAYAYAVMLDGRYSQVIRMGRGEVMKHKAESKGSDRSDSPWQKWEPAMWKKCPLRALEPYVPTSTEYRTAAALAGTVPPADGPANFTYLPPPPAKLAPDEYVEAEIVEDGPAVPAPERRPAQRPARQRKAPAAEQPSPHADMRQHFARLGFGDGDEDAAARIRHIARITGRTVTPEKPLTDAEAQKVAGELAKCKDWDALDAMLNDGEKPGGGDGE